MEIAKTILEQLGGSKFIVMTGSKNFGAGEDYLKMHLSKNELKAKYLTIKLEWDDTYTMTFSNMDKNYNIEIVDQIKGVYGDMLQKIFTQKTGLYTTL